MTARNMSNGTGTTATASRLANGVEWLTIPVVTKGRFEQPIDQVEIEKPWAEKHWRTLELAYKRAPFFEQLAPTVRAWYECAEKQARLTEVNAIFLHGIAGLLGLKTRIVGDATYPAAGAKTERLLAICRAAGADRYLSGPSAKDYFDEFDVCISRHRDRVDELRRISGISATPWRLRACGDHARSAFQYGARGETIPSASSLN